MQFPTIQRGPALEPPVINPNAAQAEARLIADLCELAELPGMLSEFVSSRASVADVRQALVNAKATISEANPITSCAAGFTGSVETALQAAASAVRSANPNMTPQQAYARALQQNPALYNQYLAANPAQTGGR